MKNKKQKTSIDAIPMNRRQFLIGGGSALMLPPLLSMMPEKVFGAPTGRVKRVIMLPTLYGMNPADFFPATPASTLQTKFVTGDSDIYTTPLSQLPLTNLSVALGSAFNDATLRSKMNLYEGMDFTSGSEIVSHTYGVFSGSCVGAVVSVDSGREPRYGETIDNIIARSSNFYKTAPSIPVLRMQSAGGDMRWSFDRSGGKVQYKSFLQGDTANFNKVFGNISSGTPTTPSPTDQDKSSIVDRTLASLTTMQNSKRISAADRMLLDRYTSGVHALQQKIQANQTVTCSKPSLKLQVTKNGQYWAFPGDYNGTNWGITSCNAMLQNFNEIIVNAFLCDATRLVMVGNSIWQDAPVSDYTAAAQFHSHDDGTGGPLSTAQKHAWFLNMVAHLAKRLDATPDPLSTTGSLLDNTVIIFSNEHAGVVSHGVFSLPTMTIGSCGGTLKTGYYIDCRQRPYSKLKDSYHESIGRPMKQLLISVMDAVGLQQSEYINIGDGNGFGDFQTNPLGATGPNYKMFSSTHNNPLPFLKA